MTAPRLTSAMMVSALVRRAQAEGGSAAVLAKGDATAGSLLVILTEKGANPRAYERVLATDGTYSWEACGSQVTENPTEVPSFLARRRQFDPDLWVIELDIPSPERFAAEMNRFG
jgi:hypothetical protein